MPRPNLPTRPNKRPVGRASARQSVQQLEEGCFVEHLDAQLLRLGQLRAGLGPCYDIGRLLRHAARDLAAELDDALAGLVAAHAVETPGEHEGLARERTCAARGFARLRLE